jgi:hypothetical protein|tara:strand:- start:176 stop:361 length:186 start_codon:yes stop_codon:yes gene_type:complete
MNKNILILALFFTINGFFSLTSFLFPAMPADKILSIQLWINALLIFSFLLPGTVAPFLQRI